MDPDAERRRLWRAYSRELARVTAAQDAEHAAVVAGLRDPEAPGTDLRPLPESLRGLRCGARTRKGTPCKRGDLFASGRCKLHGGRSTGARTDEGRARSRANLALRWPRNPVGVQEITGSEPHATATNGNPEGGRRRQRLAQAER